MPPKKLAPLPPPRLNCPLSIHPNFLEDLQGEDAVPAEIWGRVITEALSCISTGPASAVGWSYVVGPSGNRLGVRYFLDWEAGSRTWQLNAELVGGMS